MHPLDHAAAGLAPWLLLALGAALCSAMSASQLWRASSLQLATGVFALASAAFIGRWNGPQIYAGFLVLSSTALVAAALAAAARRRPLDHAPPQSATDPDGVAPAYAFPRLARHDRPADTEPTLRLSA